APLDHPLLHRARKETTSMSRNTCRLVFAALLLAAAATSAFAQQTTGSIAGRVLDEQKAAVPGATATVKKADTGFVRSELSDSEGLYRITGLPARTHSRSLEMPGFRSQTSPGQVHV